MKRVYVNENRCLGCHLCEYWCAFANSGEDSITKAFKLNKEAMPRINVEDDGEIHFAVQCRHCNDTPCVKACITGALSVDTEGLVTIDTERCVGCYTCVLTCPYGCIVIDEKNGGKTVTKCELCVKNAGGEPWCVKECINGAIVFEDRGVSI
ncbi:MAG: 4Fe-4S binding protein [Ruminococcus sp.]|jgi:carbon-monoxide dehydrogenase iron sulfur subunit|nr:4Fe-4S binding protein [Ruminococcus sp.]